MQLNDLKSGWQNAGGTLKTETDLEKMTKVISHPSLKRIRVKLIIEIIGLVFFLLVYYDWFDGDKKPFWANALLASSMLLYILNDVIGYIAIARPIRGINLKLSVQNYLSRLKRLSFLSLTVSLLYSISIIIFFTSVIDFTREKKLILAGIVATLFLMFFLSFKIWNKRIKGLAQLVEDFSLVEEK